VAPMATARARHSRRTAYQMRPTPGVTFVNRPNAQAAGHRSARTIIAARKTWMFASWISNGTGSRRSSGTARGPVSQRYAATIRALQTVMNAGHGSAVSGEIAWAKAGEYR